MNWAVVGLSDWFQCV